MAKDVLQWSSDTGEKCQEAIVRLKSGIPPEEISAQMNIPERAIKQMLLVYRSSANMPITDLLNELGLKESDVAEIKEAYFAIRGEVLWTKQMGSLSSEERRYLDFMSEIAATNTQPQPQKLIGKFGMSGTMAFGQFMKKMTEIITVEQQRLLDKISSEGDPRWQDNIDKTRAHVSAVQNLVLSGGKTETTSTGVPAFDWSESMLEHCCDIGVWLGAGIPRKQVCERFRVPEGEVTRMLLVGADDAKQPVGDLCAELNIPKEQIPQMRRDLLMMRNRLLLSKTKAELSERDRFYLERVVNESLGIRGAANLFTINDPTDSEYDLFERILVEASLNETLRSLRDLKSVVSSPTLEVINQQEAAVSEQLDRFRMLSTMAGTGGGANKFKESEKKTARRRQSDFEVAQALKNLNEAKGPLDKIKKVSALFKATKKAEKIDEED